MEKILNKIPDEWRYFLVVPLSLFFTFLIVCILVFIISFVFVEGSLQYDIASMLVAVGFGPFLFYYFAQIILPKKSKFEIISTLIIIGLLLSGNSFYKILQEEIDIKTEVVEIVVYFTSIIISFIYIYYMNEKK